MEEITKDGLVLVATLYPIGFIALVYERRTRPELEFRTKVGAWVSWVALVWAYLGEIAALVGVGWSVFVSTEAVMKGETLTGEPVGWVQASGVVLLGLIGMGALVRVIGEGADAGMREWPKKVHRGSD